MAFLPGRKHHRGSALAIMPERQRAAKKRAEVVTLAIPEASHGGPTSLPAPTPVSAVLFRPSSDPWDIR